MPPVPAGEPLTRMQLRVLGWSDSAIDELLRAGELQSKHRGVLVPTSMEATFVNTVRAASLAVPCGTIGRETATYWWGLDTPPEGSATGAVRMWVPPGSGAESRPGIEVRITPLQPDEIVVSAGVGFTSPARTVIDRARFGGFAVGLPLADAALRLGLCTSEDLAAVVARLDRARGVVAARETVRWARPGVRSHPESIVRAVLLQSGFDAPEVGYPIRDDDGYLLAEADLCYPALLVWIECDGYDVHASREAFGPDRRRQRWLERRGWLVIRVTSDDLRRPAQFLDDLRAALADAPRRVAALPPGRSPEADAARKQLIKELAG